MPQSKLPSSDIDEITDAVLTASRVLVAISARSIASVDDAITLPQFRLLVVLDGQGPLKLTALAEHLDVNPSTVTRMINRLVNADLVDREPSPLSRREVVLKLTSTGRRVVRNVMSRRRAEIRKAVTRMPASLRRGLVDALTAFAVASGESSSDGASGVVWL